MNRIVTHSLTAAVVAAALIGTAQAEIVFRDNFNYAVGKLDSGDSKQAAFQAAGWNGVKDQTRSSGARGYFYTVSSIPGYSGPFPGTDSSRVLAMEALPNTLGGQTDFYLQLGNGESAASDDLIPGDVWLQFWVYPQNYGSQQSRFTNRSKFFYVCNTAYPCHSHLWMLSNSSTAYIPGNWNPAGDPSAEFFFVLADASGVSSINNTLNPDKPNNIGPTDLSEGVKPNRWTLVKMHINTTSTSGSSYEVWLRPLGGEWTKVSEWISGRTPGFTWTIPSESVGGHRVLRMPTTVGATTAPHYDFWLYMDDFVIATEELDLPTYGDLGRPASPTDVTAE